MPRLGATHSKSERFLCVCFFHKLVFHFVIRLEVVGVLTGIWTLRCLCTKYISLLFRLSFPFLVQQLSPCRCDWRSLSVTAEAFSKWGRGERACHHDSFPIRFPVTLKTDILSLSISLFLLCCCYLKKKITCNECHVVYRLQTLVQQTKCVLTVFYASSGIEGWNPEGAGILRLWSFDLKVIR